MNISRHVIEPGFAVETRYDPERASVVVTIREETAKTIRKDGERSDGHAITVIVPRSAIREASVSEGEKPFPVLLDSYGVWNAGNPNQDYFMDLISRMNLKQLDEIREAIDEREKGIIEENERES